MFRVKGEEGKQALDRWLAWAQRCRIDVFVELACKIKGHLSAIHAALEHGLSNGLVESANTKIRLITRMAYGFADPHALIALAMLGLGGYRPSVPGRVRPTHMSEEPLFSQISAGPRRDSRPL